MANVVVVEADPCDDVLMIMGQGGIIVMTVTALRERLTAVTDLEEWVLQVDTHPCVRVGMMALLAGEVTITVHTLLVALQEVMIIIMDLRDVILVVIMIEVLADRATCLTAVVIKGPILNPSLRPGIWRESNLLHVAVMTAMEAVATAITIDTAIKPHHQAGRHRGLGTTMKITAAMVAEAVTATTMGMSSFVLS